MDTPKRIQLSRKKGWRKPENTVVVSRPSKWGNPYKLGSFVPGLGMLRTPNDLVTAFRQDLERRILRQDSRGFLLRSGLDIELRGKNLACWCPLTAECHADVLLELVNEQPATAAVATA